MSVESESKAVCAQLFRLLKEERERLGLSKYALSAKCGLSQQAIGYIERGMTSPAFDSVLRMTKAMDLDLGDLLAKATQRASSRKTR